MIEQRTNRFSHLQLQFVPRNPGQASPEPEQHVARRQLMLLVPERLTNDALQRIAIDCIG